MSEDETNYTFYGNALEPLNEDDIGRKKPIPIEDQVATDKQGRRRFHGAFTGGFSAGFFNSVGSLEGWKPSTFQSSRAEKRQQRPEDFMDDEDQEVFGIAPKVLRARSEYTDTRSRPSVSTNDTGVIPEVQGTLGEILRPVRDSVGVRLLKKMGWKPGQGVGPRVSKKEKKQQRQQNEARRIYGCDMGPLINQPTQSTNQSESSSDSDDDEVTFAPEDLPAFLVQPKTNTFGMGYTGLDRTPVLSGQSSGHVNLFEPPAIINAGTNRGGRSRGIRGQAFGVGAFEAEDEDIYGTEDMSRYDFALESVGDRRKKRWQEKQQEIKKKSSNKPDCLEGFCVSTKPMSTLQYFPPPSLPKDYVPKHVSKQSRFSKPTVEVPGDHKKSGLGRHDLTAEERSVLIGDAPSRDEKRKRDAQIDLVDLTEDSQPATKITKISDQSTSQQQLQVIPTELKSSQFNPFSHDPEKLLRYQKYLTLVKQDKREMLSEIQPAVMTEWEKSRERNEFEQASRLYQPLAGPISDRFVSSATLLGHDEKSHIEPEAVEASVSAAKLKMFGKLTRTRESWFPCSLLCKRFNVPEPHSGGAPMTSSRKRATFSVFDFLSASTQNNMQVDEVPQTSSSVHDHSSSSVEIIEHEPQATSSKEIATQLTTELNELPEANVDKVDLYKAIFLSSSEDESEETPSVAPPVQETPRLAPTRAREPSPPQNLVRNTSPPRGVFANIFQVVPPPHTSKTPPNSPPNRPQTPPQLPPDIYGPSLPSSLTISSEPNGLTPSIPIVPLNFPSKGSKWVEKTKKDKKKKKHKKHHKSKSKKKKKESKKHKKRDRTSSSSSSSD